MNSFTCLVILVSLFEVTLGSSWDFLARELHIEPSRARKAFEALQYPKAAERRSSIAQLIDADRKLDQAQLELDSLIRDVTANIIKSSNADLHLWLVFLHTERAQMLIEAKHRIEALVEAHKAAKLSREYKLWTRPKSEELVKSMELEVAKTTQDSRTFLGLKSNATSGESRKAYMKLIVLLHPDKLAQFDEQSRKSLTKLYMQVMEAYKSIQ